MATNENLIPIPGRLHSVASEGHVAGADEIYDDTLQKLQSEINADVKVMGASGTNHSKGLVPDPGATAGTTKFLREDGTWQEVNAAPEVEIGETSPVGDVKLFVDEDADPEVSIDVYTRAQTNALVATKQDTIIDIKVLGGGYYICTTAGSTADKEVTASGFVLKTNCSITILFTNAFVVTSSNPTLNVNNTGAKAIKFFGIAVPVGIIKSNTICTLCYDGTDFNITNIEYQKDVLTGNLVDLGLPSGVLWAKKNIDVTQADGFAASEFQYECSFFSWGNKEGRNPIGETFDYDWGTSNSGPYDSTAGSKLTGSIPLSQDVARATLGAPYRMPTGEESKELIDNCDFIDANGVVISSGTTNKLVTLNNIVGIYLQSKINGNRIFFSCSGRGYGTSFNRYRSYGYYWSTSLYTEGTALGLVFSNSSVLSEADCSRFFGLPIRPVQ